MKVVYESYSQPDVEFVKSVLEEAKIETWFFDPKKSDILPHLDATEEFYLTVEDIDEASATTIVKGLKP